MRIGELAERVGISADTLRFYERSGWLPRSERRNNSYREYDELDVEHIRLLIDLRRLEIPLEDASRIAAWCHTGHCADTTAELPRIIERQRAAIDTRIAALRALDRRLAELQRHVAHARPALNVLSGGAPCCDVAHAVLGIESECACCRGLPARPLERDR
jgi:MerR family transcriptional regulator, Zn(II)-responsive regulator of zntA